MMEYTKPQYYGNEIRMSVEKTLIVAATVEAATYEQSDGVTRVEIHVNGRRVAVMSAQKADMLGLLGR